MKKLRKTLSLLIAATMALSITSIAAFEDEAKINPDAKSAVDTMTKLGVFKGDENGSLNPDHMLTRAQAAKMIFVLTNNGKDDASAFAEKSTYADVPVGFWAEGYINYCTDNNFMGGWAGNDARYFDPSTELKGVELAKMLLCVLGYDMNMEDYTGQDWASKVLPDATQAGIFSDYPLSLTDSVQRQWAAKMLSNCLDCKTVSYENGKLIIGDKTFSEQNIK